MKKISLGVLSILPVSLVCLTGCGDTNGMPEITAHESRTVPVYQNISQTTPAGRMVVDRFNNSPVGYIQLGNFIESMLSESNFQFTLEYEGHVFTLTNDLTFAKCIIDFDKQTITYTNYDKYNCISDEYTPYMDVLTQGGHQFFISTLTSSKYIGNTQQRVIDMKSYNIPLYFDGDFGYVPIDILVSHVLPFLGTELAYNGKNIYLGGLNKFPQYAQKYHDEGNIFTSDYMTYTYNLLALELDSRFGHTERKRRVDGETVKFLDGGAYKTIEPFRNQLTSITPNVADTAYLKLFSEYLDDGGHTGYPALSCLIDTNAPKTYYGKDTTYFFDIWDKMTSTRKKYNLNPSAIIEKQTGKENASLHCYDEKGDTAILTFDKFVGANDYPEKATIDNYWANTINATMYANEKIKSNPNIKNLIVDLSCNTGGSAIAEQFIASWLCGGVTTTLRSTKDKTFQQQTVYADVNNDKVFDENDYVSKDINVYCVISNASFSCGNLLPSNLSDLTNCKFIGGRTGGGSCVVASMPTGLGNFYQISGHYQLGLNKSTSYDDYVTNEDGTDADFYKISYDDNDIVNFYENDREVILNKIHGK